MRVIVIGAGIVGSAVAANAAEQGAHVTLLDTAATPATGTTATTFGWVNANNKHPEEYHHLNDAAVAEHHRLAATGAPWFQGGGHLECAVDDHHRQRLHDKLARLRNLGYNAEAISPTEAHTLEPDVEFPDGADVAFFPNEGICYPESLVAHWIGQARDNGAWFRGESTVTALTREGVHLGSGEILTTDHIVCCLGRHTQKLLPEVTMTAPGRGNAAVGLLGRTQPLPIRLSRVLTTGSVNMRPAGGGRLWLQALDLDTTADPTHAPDTTIAHALEDRAVAALRPGYPVPVAELRTGVRALPTDGLPVVGPLATRPNVYVVATHSGVTLAPLLGRLVADELRSGTRTDLLAPFDPNRFHQNTSVSRPPPAPARHPGEQ